MTRNSSNFDVVLLLLPLYTCSVQNIIDNKNGYPYCGFNDSIDILRVFQGSVEGLWAVHRCGYRHADFKPGNVLLTDDYQAILTGIIYIIKLNI
jgi:hypothetical protein